MNNLIIGLSKFRRTVLFDVAAIRTVIRLIKPMFKTSTALSLLNSNLIAVKVHGQVRNYSVS